VAVTNLRGWAIAAASLPSPSILSCYAQKSAFSKNFSCQIHIRSHQKLHIQKTENVENQKIFLSPHLSLEKSQIQQKIVNVFKSFRTKDNDQFNFSIFAQGHFTKILSQGSRHFYAFDSKLSPKDFLISKGIISA